MFAAPAALAGPARIIPGCVGDRITCDVDVTRRRPSATKSPMLIGHISSPSQAALSRAGPPIFMAARRQADTGDGSEDPSQAQPALRTRSGKGEGRQLPLRVEEGGRASPSKPARRLVETPPQREDLLDLGLTLEDLPTPLRRVERSKVVLESEDFLEETAGLLNLSPDAFPRALRSRLLRVEKNRPDEPIVQFLLSTGIDRHDLNEMLEAYPRLLKVKVTDALQQKVDFLFVQLKMGPEELVEFPQYLTYDLNTRIHPRHAFLSITRLRERFFRPRLATWITPSDPRFAQHVAKRTVEEYSLFLSEFLASIEGKQF